MGTLFASTDISNYIVSRRSHAELTQMNTFESFNEASFVNNQGDIPNKNNDTPFLYKIFPNIYNSYRIIDGDEPTKEGPVYHSFYQRPESPDSSLSLNNATFQL